MERYIVKILNELDVEFNFKNNCHVENLIFIFCSGVIIIEKRTKTLWWPPYWKYEVEVYMKKIENSKLPIHCLKDYIEKMYSFKIFSN